MLLILLFFVDPPGATRARDNNLCIDRRFFKIMANLHSRLGETFACTNSIMRVRQVKEH